MSLEGGPGDSTGFRIERTDVERGPELDRSGVEFAPTEIGLYQARMGRVFGEFGAVLLGEDAASEVEVFQRPDRTHGLFRGTTDSSTVLHVMGMPEFSTDETMFVRAGILDYLELQGFRGRQLTRGRDMVGWPERMAVDPSLTPQSRVSYNNEGMVASIKYLPRAAQFLPRG